MRKVPGLRGIAVVVTSAVGTAYIAAVLMAAGPMTPLSIKYGPSANSMLSPYFQQNWQLFAPAPISEERGLVARARCLDGEVTEFRDVTSEHIEAVQASRFFPSRMSRMVSNGMVQVFLEDPILARLRGEERKSGSSAEEDASVLPLTGEEVETRAQGEMALALFARRELMPACAHGIAAVQLRYVLHSFPRWSERERWQETGDVDVLESEWIEVDA